MSGAVESVLLVPTQLVQRFTGLCVDFGASAIKFIYRSKEEGDQLTQGDTKYGHLHLVSYPRRELSTALEYVRQRAVITGGDSKDERPTIFTTGVGCTQHGKLISDTLGVKLQQHTEFECVVKGFLYLASHIPQSELFEPAADEVFDSVASAMKNIITASQTMDTTGSFVNPAANAGGIEAIIRQMSLDASASALPLCQQQPDAFPCLLVICGSAFAFMKVEKDGSFKIVDMSTRGGRTFCGLGSLLTGCETFEELLELAANGTDRTVNEYSIDVNFTSDAVDNDNSDYIKMGEQLKDSPIMLFSFGKSVGSNLGEFKREDLSRTLLDYMAQDLVQTVQYITAAHGLKRIFFTGGFCATPLVRSVITANYVQRSIWAYLQGQVEAAAIDFVKPGPYLGAIGCVIHDAERSAAKS